MQKISGKRRNVGSGNGHDEVRARSEFPKHTLEEALRVAAVLSEKNGGQPLPPTDLAIALGKSPGSSDFRILLSSSIKYGLTTGSYNQERVSLQELGRDIAEPKSPEDQRRAQIEAALTPPTFRGMYTYYRGKKLPDKQFFENTVIREFEIPRDQGTKCVSIFSANMRYVGLVREASTGMWLSGDANVSEASSAQAAEASDREVVVTTEDVQPSVPRAERPAQSALSNAIFLGHGGNHTPLNQLKDILEQYKIPYKVAVDEAHGGRPISEKVAETMKECGAAILIFTADAQFQDASGKTVWKPSENAVYELGAASVLYGKKIVIFKESTVDFPANFRDIGHISFEKDQLTAKAIELFRELIAFGLVKISVGS